MSSTSSRTGPLLRQPAFQALCQVLSYGEALAATGDRRNWATHASAVVACAIRDGVAPLLYARLRDQGLVGSLPADCAQTLQESYLITAAENRRLFHWLHQVLIALDAAQIPVIVLKGAHLAALVYGHPGLRPMADVDLLVPERDLARLDRALAPGAIRRAPYGDEVEQPVRHVSYRTPAGGLFEFHVHLLSPRWPAHFDQSALWEAAQPAEIEGAATRVLAPEHLLLHLCAHQFSHRPLWTLKGLCDIGETIRRCGVNLDWDMVVRDSTAWRLQRCVYVALAVAEQLLAVPIPAEALTRMCPSDLPADALTTVITGLAEPDDMWRLAPVAQLWSDRTPGQRIRVLLQAAFAPRREVAYTYQVSADSPYIVWYYPLRWITRLDRALRLLWAMLRRDPTVRRQVAQQNRWQQLREYLFQLS